MGSSKRALRLKKDQWEAIRIHEEMMKGVSSTSIDNNKTLVYKLQWDIEGATNLKKVLGERIMNGKEELP